MKTISTILMAAVLAAGTFTTFAQADSPLERLMRQRAMEDQNLGGQPAAAAGTPVAAPPPTTEPATPVEVSAAPQMDLPLGGNGTNGIRLNFDKAQLSQVLKYLSAAAGFHIIMDAQVRGTVTVISNHDLTKDEAVILLNSVLNKNGYAAIRNDQILTIVDKGDAKNRNIPVIVQSDPDKVPNNDIIVTQIIPLRFVEAGQLVKDLSPFVAQSATIIANEAGNSIVITDTQANIRHLCEIIKAIDSSAEASTEIRVFHLQHANPSDVATLLSGVFPSQSSTGGSQTPVRFGGGGGGGGGGRGGGGFGGGGGGNPFAAMFGGGGGGNSGSNDRIRKQTQVIAVADLRTSSVVVTAQKDLMGQIDEMIKQLDVSSTRDQKVYVFHMNNGDPQQALSVLQGAFPSSSTSRNGTSASSQPSALQTRETQGANSSSGSTGSASALGNNRSGGGNTRGGGIQF